MHPQAWPRLPGNEASAADRAGRLHLRHHLHGRAHMHRRHQAARSTRTSRHQFRIELRRRRRRRQRSPSDSSIVRPWESEAGVQGGSDKQQLTEPSFLLAASQAPGAVSVRRLVSSNGGAHGSCFGAVLYLGDGVRSCRIQAGRLV
ncbi:hypothetical protein B296_00058616 [Ensete ventricosum]|uniref:Uncharacterized protein n=1 Tax=Ensete ventricosum TaxID=4639 RepID=A0A426X7E2_ENSVE|nr:hypothetical protein B296_00058616 [Ensete ventricosum]